MSSTKDASAPRVPARQAGSSDSSRAASKNGIWRKAAVCAMRWMVVLPMPRLGVLMIRMQLTSSDVLTASLRYAVTSLISARSKNLVPPTMR